MKLLQILFIGFLFSIVTGCKSTPSVCEPTADDTHCDFPKRNGFINDYCNFLTADETKNLERIAQNYFAQTGTQIIVVIEDSKKSHSRKFHCPMGVMGQWKLDCNRFDDVLIVISKRRHYVDFNYGINADSRLTAEDRKNILRKNILPAFYRKQYYDGLRRGIAYIIEHRKNS